MNLEKNVNYFITDFCSKVKSDSADSLRKLFLYNYDAGAAYNELMYNDIIEYFHTKVMPHKIEVYNAGVELLQTQGLSNFLSNNEKHKFELRLLTHDFSKLSINESIGYSTFNFETGENRDDFDLAWHHHKMNNDHHPEHWFNVGKDGGTKVLEMPTICLFEMIADWIGAGRTYGNTIDDWLPKNIDRFTFHPKTAKKLSLMLKPIGFSPVVNSNKIQLKPTS